MSPEDVDQRGHLGVVAGRDRQLEHLGDQQTDETHGPRGGQLDVRDPLPPGPDQRVDERGDVELQLIVERERERGDDRQLMQRRVRGRARKRRATVRNEDLLLGLPRAGDETGAPGRDAVHLVERIAEHRQPIGALGKLERGPALPEGADLALLPSEMMAREEHRGGGDERSGEIAERAEDSIEVEVVHPVEQLAQGALDHLVRDLRDPVDDLGVVLLGRALGDLENVQSLAGSELAVAKAREEAGDESLTGLPRSFRCGSRSPPRDEVHHVDERVAKVLSLRATLLQMVVGRVLDAHGHRIEVCLLAGQSRPARRALIEKRARRQVAVDLRIDRAAASVHVVVRARDERLASRRAAVGDDAVLLRQGRDHLGRQPVEDGEQIGLDPSIDQPVDSFERREQQDGLLEDLAVEAPVGAEERMREAVRDLLAVQVVTEVVDVSASGLNLLVVVLGDVPGQHVHDAAVLRKDRGDLLGEEEVRTIDQRQPARQGVVIRERHQRHAARLAQLVLSRGGGVALGTAKHATVPFIISRGGGRMDVQIAACWHEPWGPGG